MENRQDVRLAAGGQILEALNAYEKEKKNKGDSTMTRDQKRKETIEKAIALFFATYKDKKPGYLGTLLEQQQLVRLALAEQILAALNEVNKTFAGVPKGKAIKFPGGVMIV